MGGCAPFHRGTPLCIELSIHSYVEVLLCSFNSVTREETEKLLLTYRNLATVRLDKQKKTPNRLSGSKDESSYLIDRSHFRDLLHKSFGMTDDFLMDRGMCATLIEHTVLIKAIHKYSNRTYRSLCPNLF